MRKAIRTFVVILTLIGASVVLSAQAIPRPTPTPTSPPTKSTEGSRRPSGEPQKTTPPPTPPKGSGGAVQRTPPSEPQRGTQPPVTRTPPSQGGQAVPRPPQTEEQRRTPPQGGKAIPRPPEPEIERVTPFWIPRHRWEFENPRRWIPVFPRYPYVSGCSPFGLWDYQYSSPYWYNTSDISIQVFNPERVWVDIEDVNRRVIVQRLCPGGRVTIFVDLGFDTNYWGVRLIARDSGQYGYLKTDEFEIGIFDSRGRPLRIQREYSWVIRLR